MGQNLIHPSCWRDYDSSRHGIRIITARPQKTCPHNFDRTSRRIIPQSEVQQARRTVCWLTTVIWYAEVDRPQSLGISPSEVKKTTIAEIVGAILTDYIKHFLQMKTNSSCTFSGRPSRQRFLSDPNLTPVKVSSVSALLRQISRTAIWR